MLTVLLSGIIAGIGLGFLRGGQLVHLTRLKIRLGWLLILAVLVQLVATLWLLPRAGALAVGGGVLLLSHLAVLVAVWHNRHLPGLWLVGLGVLLNVLATTPHGGLMPVTPETLRAAGRVVPAELPPSGSRPHTHWKDIVLPREQIPLWVISDRFAVPAGWPLAGVFSLGDVAVAGGLAWLLAWGMTGRRLATGATTRGEDNGVSGVSSRAAATDWRGPD